MLVELQAVSKRYGGKAVVQDVSFGIAKGEIVGFLGPNGAGKTTTLRMIAGVIAPTNGRVTVAGCDMATDNARAARSIGYAPEHPPLYDALDVSSYLRFVAKAKGVAPATLRSECERVAGACRLEAVFRKEIYKLSKGYRQRLGLAQALLGSPQVLLLDEPTAGLDPAQIQETRELIRSLGERHAVLLSTHLLTEVTMICARVAIIQAGRLLAIDSPAGLRRASEEADCVVLQLAAPAEGAREALAALSGVRALRVEAREGVLELACEVDAAPGIEAEIARTAVARWRLLRLERRQPTLENVFLRYVRATP